MNLRGSFLKTLESTTVSIEPTTVAIEPASPRRPMIARLSRTNRLLTYSPFPQITCMKIINNVFTFSPAKLKDAFLKESIIENSILLNFSIFIVKFNTLFFTSYTFYSTQNYRS